MTLLQRLLHRLPRLALILLCVLIAACERGPDPDVLRADLQGALDAMDDGLLRVVALKAQGTGPALAADEVIAYANVTLELARDHDFGGWDGATLGTLASTLGATDQGVRGIVDGGNAAGERVHVHASAIYARDGARDGARDTGRWRHLGGGAPEAGAVSARAPSDSLLAQIETILARGQDSTDTAGRLFERELSTAIDDIHRQLEQVQAGAMLASGPAGGEYARIANALAWAATRHGLHLEVLNSEGSVDNVQRVHAGEATLAIAQSDVLALAATAHGPFDRGGAALDVVALSALYPEPVHVIVLASSDIETPADLAGRRVALGPVGSGTRLTARRVLSAHGVSLFDLARIDGSELEAAASALSRGEVDAMFATIGAPAGAIRRLAARQPIRLLDLDAAAISAMSTDHQGYLHHRIARGTYRGQYDAVSTVATTAVLIASSTLLDSLVEHTLQALLIDLDYRAAGTVQVGLIGAANAMRGVTIALHPAARRFHEETAARPPASR